MVMVSAVPPDPVTDTVVTSDGFAVVLDGGFTVVLDGAVAGACVCGVVDVVDVVDVVPVVCGGRLAVCDPHPATASASDANTQIGAARCLISEP
jgi:hypothetical protein